MIKDDYEIAVMEEFWNFSEENGDNPIASWWSVRDIEKAVIEDGWKDFLGYMSKCTSGEELEKSFRGYARLAALILKEHAR